MKRNFDNFLEAYCQYADDKFCPPKFHLWTGLSILAASLERKISLRQGKVHHVPNIYVMLVSHPAIGKSTAMDVGVDLIEGMREKHNLNFRIIPNQITEPAFLDMMKIVERYPIGDKFLPHSSGFFYASEASSSALQNTCGDFVATLTAFYDCPRYFRKKIKMEKNEILIENGCMNLLAGTTFNFLKELVDERSVMGGFASRLLYVVSRERKVREAKWDASRELDLEMREKLIDDLGAINKLIGPMRPTSGFIKRIEKWQPDFDKFLIELNNPKLESILSRKGTNLLKVSMLVSIAESNDMILEERHFDKAKELLDDVTEDNSHIITQAAIADVNSQSGLNELILEVLRKKSGRASLQGVKAAIIRNGNDVTRMQPTIDAMLAAHMIKVDGQGNLELT